MNRVYLLLGSNIGDSRAWIRKAKDLIGEKIGPVSRASALYQTAAWGETRQGDFINQVILVTSDLKPAELMEGILGIETRMGRIRTKKNAPRIIDIDILFYGKAVIREKDLEVPHPRIPLRRFVLVPMNELSPQFIHPVLKKTIHQLLRVCPDKGAVKKI